MERILILLSLALFLATLVFYYVRRAGAISRERRLARRLGIADPIATDAPEASPNVVLRGIRAAERVVLSWVAGSGLKPSNSFYAGTAAAAVLAFLFANLTGHPTLGVMSVIAIVCAPLVYIRMQYVRRLKLIGEQLPYLLDLSKSALESGHTLVRALQMAETTLPSPIREEVEMLLDRVQLGRTLVQSLQVMHERIPIDELGQLIVALTIQSQVGNSLAETLQHVSDTLRNRQRIAQQIRSLTAQARSSAVIVSMLPVAVLFLMSLIQPSYSRTLFETHAGLRLLEVAIVLDVGAFLIARRMVQVNY